MNKDNPKNLERINMQETVQNPKSHSLKLEAAVEEYKDDLLRTAISLMRNKGVKNPETIGPDIVQQVYLRLLKNKVSLPSDKKELRNLLHRYVQSCVQQYLEYSFDTGAIHPLRIRDVDLSPLNLKEVENIASQSSQNQLEKQIDLENFRKFIKDAKNISTLQKRILIGIIEGKKDEELARELNYTRANINQHKLNALEKLKKNPRFRDFLNSWTS